jgi:hypothetical protein
VCRSGIQGSCHDDMAGFRVTGRCVRQPGAGAVHQPQHHMMATLRRDGSPRISGTEVKFIGGQLVLGMMGGTACRRLTTRSPGRAPHPYRRPSSPRRGSALVVR